MALKSTPSYTYLAFRVRHLPVPAVAPVSKPLAMRHTILTNSHVIVVLFLGEQDEFEVFEAGANWCATGLDSPLPSLELRRRL